MNIIKNNRTGLKYWFSIKTDYREKDCLWPYSHSYIIVPITGRLQLTSNHLATQVTMNLPKSSHDSVLKLQLLQRPYVHVNKTVLTSPLLQPTTEILQHSPPTPAPGLLPIPLDHTSSPPPPLVTDHSFTFYCWFPSGSSRWTAQPSYTVEVEWLHPEMLNCHNSWPWWAGSIMTISENYL